MRGRMRVITVGAALGLTSAAVYWLFFASPSQLYDWLATTDTRIAIRDFLPGGFSLLGISLWMLFIVLIPFGLSLDLSTWTLGYLLFKMGDWGHSDHPGPGAALGSWGTSHPILAFGLFFFSSALVGVALAVLGDFIARKLGLASHVPSRNPQARQ